MIAREHGAPAGHRYLARQNLAEPLRSKATAQKEGGIVHQTREPREAGIGRQPSRRQQAKNLHQQALELYHQGNHRDAIKLEQQARSLAGIGGVGSGGIVGNAIEQAAADFGSAAYNAPGAAIVTGRSVGKDVAGATHGDYSFKRSRALAKAIGLSTVADFRHPLRHPGFTALDAFALASAGAGAASRVGAASKAIRAGEGVRGALARKAPGEIDLPGGVQALEHDNPLLNVAPIVGKRARMRRVTRALEREGQTPPVPKWLAKETSAQSVVGREIRAREQVLSDFSNAAPEALRHRLKGLTPEEHTAMRLRAIEGYRATRSPAETVTRQVDKHNRLALRAQQRATELATRAEGHPRLEARLRELQSQAVLNREIAKDIERARPVLENPSPHFRETVVAARRESMRQEQQLVGSNRLTAQGAKTRRARIAAIYGRTQGERPPRYFNQHGDYFHKRVLRGSRETAHNIHDEHGNVIGSMVYDARPEQKSIYVESVYIRPEFRSTANLKRLVEPLLRDGRPIQADFSNPRLQRLFERAAKRGLIQGKVLEPRTGRTIARGEASASELPPLRKSAPAPAGSFYFPAGERFAYPTRSLRGGPVSRRPGATGLRAPQEGRYMQGTLRKFTGGGIAKGAVVQKPGEAIASRGLGINRLESAQRMHEAVMHFAKRERSTAYDIPVAKTLTPEVKREVAAMIERIDTGDETALVRAEEKLKQILAPTETSGTRYLDSRYLKEFASSARGLKAMAAVNKPFRFGGVYFRPAYLVTNRPQNFIMRHLAQGIVSKRPIRGSVRDIEQELGPEASAGLHALSGTTRTEAFRSSHWVGRREREITDWIQKHTDSGERFLAILARAHQKGYRTPEELRQLGTQTAHDSEKLVNDRVSIARRARKDMVDFSVTPGERSLSDFIYFYPWLSRGSVWSGRFIAEHPLKSAAIAQTGRQAREQGIGDLGPIPSWLKGQVNTRFGLVNPNPLNSFSTPAQIVDAVKDPATARSFGSEFGTPIVQAITNEPAQIPRRIVSSLSPLSFAQRLGVLGHPSKTFPDTGIVPAVGKFVVGGPFPQHPDWSQVRKQAYAEMPSPERFTSKMGDLRETLKVEGKKTLGAKTAKLPPELDKQLKLHETRYGAYKQADAKGQQEMYLVDLKLLQKMGQLSPEVHRRSAAWAKTASDSDISDERRRITEEFFPTDWLNASVRQLKDKGVKVSVPY